MESRDAEAQERCALLSGRIASGVWRVKMTSGNPLSFQSPCGQCLLVAEFSGCRSRFEKSHQRNYLDLLRAKFLTRAELVTVTDAQQCRQFLLVGDYNTSLV